MKNKEYPLYPVATVNNLQELLAYTAENYGDSPAFTFLRNKEAISVSYRRFKAEVEKLAAALFHMGIQNTKAAVIGENSYEWILTYFAVVNSGNVIVPLDRDLPAPEIQRLLDDSGAKVLVYSDTYSDIAEHARKSGSDIRHYINMNSLPELMDKCGPLIDLAIDSRALAALLYTSGTTGAPKGVMLSQYALMRCTISACQNVGIVGSNMLVLPLHHSFGFLAGVCAMLLYGSEIFITSSLKNILADMEYCKPCNMFVVPLFVEAFYKKIWDSAKKRKKATLLKKLIRVSNWLLHIGIDIRRVAFKSVHQAFGGNLKLLVSGGAPLDAKYIQGFRDFGIVLLNGYGITECSPIVSVNRNHYYRDGSVGRVLSCCEVKIIEPDENGHGEICVKGDNVMLGYYNNEQATKDAFDNEWFTTGDMGYLDGDGFLYISGRKKNVIVLSSGKNVYPEELEFALLNIPYIREALVYAEENILVAEVFLDTENEPDCASRLAGDILELNRNLPAFKNIGKTVLRGMEFPKTTTKKIKR